MTKHKNTSDLKIGVDTVLGNMRNYKDEHSVVPVALYFFLEADHDWQLDRRLVKCSGEWGQELA